MLHWLRLAGWLVFWAGLATVACGDDGSAAPNGGTGGTGAADSGGSAGDGVANQPALGDAGDGGSGASDGESGGTGAKGGTRASGGAGGKTPTAQGGTRGRDQPTAGDTGDAGDGNDTGSGGTTPTAGTGGVLPSGRATRLTIEPAGALLTPGAPRQRLELRAFDANGDELAPDVTWSSNHPDIIAVDASGEIRAESPLGSALVTAEADGVRATILVLAAEPVAEAVLVRDDEVVGEPLPVDALAPLATGYQTVVELATGVPLPAPGAILLGSGSKPISGRVASLDARKVTLELVSPDEAFEHLSFSEDIALADAPSPAPELAPLPFELELGKFKCEVEGSLGELELPKKDYTVDALNTVHLVADWDDDTDRLRELTLRGTPRVTFELEPTISAALEGKVECQLELEKYEFPIPGWLKFAVGGSFKLGFGVSLGGKIPLASAAVNLKGQVSAELRVGIDCHGSCAPVQEFETTGSLTPKFIAPEATPSLRIEADVQAFVWAELEGGAAVVSKLRTEALEAKAGLKLGGSFATEEGQVTDPAYSSSYALTAEAEFGPGETVKDFIGFLKLTLSVLKWEKSVPLANSPTGSMRVDRQTFEVGDTVNFTVDLVPENTLFSLFGYNVKSVRIYRRETREDGTYSLVLAGEQTATDSQFLFVIPWLATIAGDVTTTPFVAFVEPVLMPYERHELRQLLSGVVSYDYLMTDGWSDEEGVVLDERDWISSTVNLTLQTDGTNYSVVSATGTYGEDYSHRFRYSPDCHRKIDVAGVLDVGTEAADQGTALAYPSVVSLGFAGSQTVTWDFEDLGCATVTNEDSGGALSLYFTVKPDGTLDFTWHEDQKSGTRRAVTDVSGLLK